MSKIRIVIEADYDIDKATYAEVYDENMDIVELTEEERNALTPEQALEYDARFIQKHEYNIGDQISYLAGDKKVYFELGRAGGQFETVVTFDA